MHHNSPKSSHSGFLFCQVAFVVAVSLGSDLHLSREVTTVNYTEGQKTQLDLRPADTCCPRRHSLHILSRNTHMHKDTPWPYMLKAFPTALFSPLCHSCSHYAVTEMRLKANKLFNPRRLRKKQEKTLSLS